MGGRALASLPLRASVTGGDLPQTLRQRVRWGYLRCVGEAEYPLWTVHIADLVTEGTQVCARCGEAIAEEGVTWPRGRLVAIRERQRRVEVRLIDARDDLLDDERPCGEQ